MAQEQTLADVKDNLQEVGDRIKNALSNLTIPVRMYQDRTTAERRSGYYIEQLQLERFTDFVVRYYTTKGMGNTEPYQHLSALVQSMLLLRDQTANDLEKLYTLVDQLVLLHERLTERAIREAVDRALKRAADPGPQPDVVERQLPPGQDVLLGLQLQPAAQDPGAPPAHLIAPIAREHQDPELRAIGQQMAAVRREADQLRAQIPPAVDLPAPTGTVPMELPELEPLPVKGKAKQGMSVPDDADDDSEDDADLDDEADDQEP